LSGLKIEPRRRSWRLGRWTAKAAVGKWLSLEPGQVEVLAAPDGAPEAWLDGERLPVSISISHRGGIAIAAIVDAPRVVGCDLELIEPRSEAFIREWLAPAEQALLDARCAEERPLLANLIWTAKEAAAKLRREGLRLNVRHAVVKPETHSPTGAEWNALEISWAEEAEAAHGWWHAEPDWVATVALT
jgi:4'-phosphopantetheinyl transferase